MIKRTIWLLMTLFVLTTTSVVTTVRECIGPAVMADAMIAENTEMMTVFTEQAQPKEEIRHIADTYEISVEETTHVELIEGDEEEQETILEVQEEEPYKWEGDVLTARKGTVQGPNGKETWYNLDMTGVIWIMESEGYFYEYHIREDGVKMYGDYIMCAANLNIFPRGSIVETSLGRGMICDSCLLATQMNSTQIDIAVNWR